MTQPIAFIDLQAQRRRIASEIERAVTAAVEGGQWVMGPQVRALEQQLAEFAGVKHCIACANGTDALMIVLRAWAIGPGDAVFVPAFTFAASAEVVALVGATPVFVDVLEDTYNLNPQSLEAAIAMVKREGKLKPRAIMPVDLFGQPADYRAIEPIAAREELKLLVDTAQAFGATLDGRQTASIGDAAGTSFFPAKPLGCYGDGGATFTNDDGLTELLRSIRVHGQGADKYENVRIGVNSRLDTIQAAILIEKLKIFPEEIEMRERVARRYTEAFRRSNQVRPPHVVDGAQSTWAQYTLQVPDRDKLAADLKAKGIPTATYYPTPLSHQKGYAQFPSAGTPVSDRISKHVISLPMHPYLDEATQDRIIAAVLESIGAA
ncbi:MAG TPA: DegT/DnrJ/EryC1/StrS aminotransferase family protein [Rhizomicrobium sp.]|jgi:dTDP-4-amino-4,6-dideoxygalactose transaminase|nr:DegT/DnrJ/EryC1/StrS aminotransferase family protein [Rhizomicrobium sp.]